MTYEEFNSRYNKYDNKGVCVHCSYIDMNGNVLFEGTTEEVENWYEKALENDTLDIRRFDDPTMFGFTNLGKSCFDKPYYKAKLEQL